MPQYIENFQYWALRSGALFYLRLYIQASFPLTILSSFFPSNTVPSLIIPSFSYSQSWHRSLSLTHDFIRLSGSEREGETFFFCLLVAIVMFSFSLAFLSLSLSRIVIVRKIPTIRKIQNNNNNCVTLSSQGKRLLYRVSPVSHFLPPERERLRLFFGLWILIKLFIDLERPHWFCRYLHLWNKNLLRCDICKSLRLTYKKKLLYSYIDNSQITTSLGCPYQKQLDISSWWDVQLFHGRIGQLSYDTDV